MKIRKMKPEDIDRIVAITKAAWGDDTMHKLLEDRYGVLGGKGWEERKAGEIRALFSENPANAIVAVEDGEVVGYAAFMMDAEAGIGHVLDNAVDPEFQGRGIGTAMNKWTIDFFRRAGMKIARVSTLLHDLAAKRIYEKNGFEELARTIHYSMRISDKQQGVNQT